MSQSHSALKHIEVSYPEPHFDRTRQILAAHPEVKTLFGNKPSSAFFVFAIVALQLGVAFALRNSPVWVIFLASYTVGAAANHAMWVLIHECTHNLIFKSALANCWLALVANLPILFPSALSFRTYHIKHHLHQGDYDRDADLPRPFEAAWVGNSTLKKATWFLFFFASQLVRVPYLKGIEMINRWVILNWITEVTFLTGLTYLFGFKALLFIALSSVFSIGLHPLGARWIQEHYVVHPNQETYSYYGPLNKIAFNVGYHNEHHDLMGVAWSNLPKIRAAAPEFYDTLFWHKSWTLLLLQFLRDPRLSLYSRVIRTKAASPLKNRPSVAARAATSELTPAS